MDISSFCMSCTLKKKMPGSKRSTHGLNGRKLMKKFLRKARKLGFVWEIKRSGHIHIRHLEIAGLWATSSTPKNESQWVNEARDKLRRRFGVEVV